MEIKQLALFAMSLLLNGILFGDSMIFTLSDPKGDDNSKMFNEYSISREIQAGDHDIVSLSARSHGDQTIFEVTFAKPVKTPDDRVISMHRMVSIPSIWISTLTLIELQDLAKQALCREVMTRLRRNLPGKK